jgi:hypothetical protein
VKVTPPLPVGRAVALNDAPLAATGGTRYSGDSETLGAVARAHGFAGGMPSDKMRDWGDCEGWHIDTPEGLAAFVRWLKTNL